MRDQSGKIVLVLVLILLLLGAGVYFFLPQLQEQEYSDSETTYSPEPAVNIEGSNSSAEMKDYHSKALKISFKVPEEAQVEEKFNNLMITLPYGKISVSFNGTNFESAREYYEDLKVKHKLSPKEYSENVSKDYNYVVTIGEDPNNRTKSKKTYFIYADYAVYIFSTSDESLHLVLDQIVQSFEYKP